MNNNNYEKALEFYNNGEYEKAIEYYKKAAGQGDVECLFLIGAMHEAGEGVEKDYLQAFYWFEKAAKYNIKQAQYMIGKYYDEGLGVEENLEKAAFWYEKAAEQGDIEAQVNLGYLFERLGQFEKAIAWYNRAAQSGDIIAINNLGALYLDGKGVEKDYKKAFEMFSLSAEKGEECALANLGEMYYNGNGVKKSYKKAIQYFKKALKTNSEFMAEASYYLAECYYYGYGLKPNWQKAKECYEKAIELGYNCRYALEMVKRDLNEYDTINGIQKYAKETISKKLFPSDLILKIRKDLEEDFGEYWIQLKQNAQKALISGVFSYINFYSLGEEFYKDLDFTPCITAMAKALEIELAEFFFKHYLAFLKEKGASPTEFNEKQCFINVDEEDIYSFAENHETYRFSLGALWYVIDAKMEAPLEIQKERVGRSEIYRKIGKAITTISKYMVEFADELFKEDAFSLANREKEIVNYLVDLAADVRDIKKIRNPAAHSDTMTCAQAEVCGDYLIKVRKLICNILSKIKDEYK